MRLVFDARIHLNHMSGISRYIINVVEGLAKIAESDEIIVLHNAKLPENDVLFERLGNLQNVDFYKVKGHHFGPSNYIIIPPVLKKINPNIYHYPHLDAPTNHKFKTVATIHDPNFSNNTLKFKDFLGLKKTYFKQSLKNTLINSSKIVFISEAMKNEVIELYKNSKLDNSKFVSIYNGLDTEFISMAEKIKKSKTPSKNKLPYLLFVGQIREHKNVTRILTAFEKFRGDYPDFELILIGKHYDRNIKLNKSGVKHLGIVNEDELINYYLNAKALIFPSLLEGFGLPILEAMQCGLPILTTNYGATKEISGNAALLVNPLDLDEIYNGMIRIVSDENLRGILKTASFEQVERFTWESSAQKLYALYHELI